MVKELKKINKKFEESEGEELIREFFESTGEDVKVQKKIILKNDYADYRVADFYLPRYKIYVEFLGKWDEEKCREKYKKKMKIYRSNNVPCVYLYPDNLGILNFIFLRRLKKVLKEHKMNWQLFKCNLQIFYKEYGLAILVFGILIYFLEDIKVRVIFGILLVFTLINAMRKVFLK